MVCCDMILGVQLLKSLDQIIWDFNKLQMEFSINAKRCVLTSPKTSPLKLINNKQLSNSIQGGAEFCFLNLNEEVPSLAAPSCQLFSLEVGKPDMPIEFEALIDDYADAFKEPTKLPPSRPRFDHKIPLQEGLTPFNLQPYGYSIIQKKVVGKLVNEMLEHGIVRHNNSPFASPEVMVRKKDGSWRLCVDHRRLNQHTVKDRFPIPLIEDLMHELGTATLFSKLDLRVGFNKLRIEEGEEFTPAFKIHGGHFEYLVMPFGLTNAPASFQSFMNHIFQPYLRRFVIVFFDDILICSPNLEARVGHLTQVFNTVRAHNIFLKKEKCHFATTEVE